MRSLVWFRSDLRVADNPALSAAVSAGDDGCAAVFVLTPTQWRAHDWGAAKVDFLLRNLAALSNSLAAAGIPLLVRSVPDFADVPEELAKVSRRHHCDGLFFNREYEVNERRRDEKVLRHFRSLEVPVHSFDDQVVVPPGDVRTAKGDFYSVFTPFKRRWSRELSSRGLPDLCPHPPKGDHPPFAKPDPVPVRIRGFEQIRHLEELWPAGEAEASARLSRFLAQRALSYQQDRDIPAADATSRLSPYLSLGVISVRSCLEAALAANRGELEGGLPGIETWISELVWREFYRHVLVGFPRVSMGRAFRKEMDSIEWVAPEPGFSRWCEGCTGVPFVDAGVRQLVQEGWMHNRLRMITAMFLAKDLLVDWRQGERFFMRQLVDADLASNNGGWQWAASTGTDAAPYFRIFNPWTQGRRFDPEALYVKRYVPELGQLEAGIIHDPTRLATACRAGLDYPEPVVDHSWARERAIQAFEAVRSRSRETGSTR